MYLNYVLTPQDVSENVSTLVSKLIDNTLYINTYNVQFILF